MSSYPPYNNDNPYVPPTQYPSQPGYYPPDQPPQYGYQQPAYPQSGYAPQQYVAVPVMQVDEPGYGQALTGLILGIVSLFFPIVGIAGLIFSIIGLKSISRKGMAIAGLITSIVGILFVVFAIVLILIAVAAASASGSSTY